MKRVTVLLPELLIEDATKASGVGLTPTIRLGLDALIRSKAYRELKGLRGKVKLSLDVGELRRD
jgi:hypothetical protein